MKLFELNDEFFRPVWKRVLIVAATVGWACFEFYSGQTFWGVIFLGIGVYAIYGLFIAFDPDAASKTDDKPE
ncbi:MAG: DUF3329 domain-containing protein [Rhizobiaceae bacterium]|jgi:hypothetical protein|nr:DUF3329 domain-containing protein [Rhizobiaceae bacterium]